LKLQLNIVAVRYFLQTILRVVKLSDTRDYCQDTFNQWCYCFTCRSQTSPANWNTLESYAAGRDPSEE